MAPPTPARADDLEGRVRELVADNAALLASELEWRQLVEAMPQIVWITRPDGWHTHFNRQWLDFTGLTLEESLGFGWNPPFHPDDRDRAAARWQEATTSGEPYEIEYRLRRADGVYHWMLGRAMPLRDADGRIVKWFGTCTDIQELKEAQERIDEQARLLDQTQDAIVVFDLDHRVLHWSGGAERILGWSASEAVGRHLLELACPDPVAVSMASEAVVRHGSWCGELRCRNRLDEELVMEGRWTLLRHPDGSPRATLAVNTDVTERRAMEAEYVRMLEARATQDPLTGLPNRMLLFDRLEQHLRQRDRPGLAVAFVDLDGFKAVNDTLGHRVGDELLVQVARRLQDSVRDGDVVARMGGDEFVVAAGAADERAALLLADRLTGAVSGPTEVAGNMVAVAASVGVTWVDGDDSGTAGDIVSRADAAMYAVKRHQPRAADRERDRLSTP